MLINIIPNKLGKYIIYLGVTFLTASPFVGKSWRNFGTVCSWISYHIFYQDYREKEPKWE